MKVFLDTSVLVAAFYGDHEHHVPSLDIFAQVNRKDACCAAHSLAEVYATLTGMPPKHRVGGDTALLFLQDIRDRLTLVSLNANEYYQAVVQASRSSLSSGAIYDALLGFCAVKAKAKTLYTWNIKDFIRLPHPIPDLVKRPDKPH